MKTLAAVLVEHNRPLELADLEIPPLRPGQVLVEIAYSGVCRTQLGEVKGWRGPDKFLPHCLGHEAGGWVRETPPNPSGKVKRDQPVVLSWLKGGGADAGGAVYKQHIQTTQFIGGNLRFDVNAGPVTTFQKYAVVSENRVTPLAEGVDMKQAALLGCPLPTGIGAVWNTANARPGQSVAVFGCGGVGLSAILGAKLAGCCPIIAVDVYEREKNFEMASRSGATILQRHASSDAPVFPCGLVDVAVEASGSNMAMLHAIRCVKPRGGIAVVLGNARRGEMLTIDPRWLNDGKQLRGSWGGDTDVDRDFPRLMRLMASGKLDVSPLIGEVFPLERVNEALAALESGGIGRPILDMGAKP